MTLCGTVDIGMLYKRIESHLLFVKVMNQNWLKIVQVDWKVIFSVGTV